MKNDTWIKEVEQLNNLLLECSFRDGSGREMDVEQGFCFWQQAASNVRDCGNVVYLIGNGASASMASHFAADLSKNAYMHTQVFFDLSLLTAVSNDLGYDKVFAEPLHRSANRDDMLIAISSSGFSTNIISAVNIAREIGLVVITLSSMKPENNLRSLGDLNIYVGANNYGHAETCHAAILHHFMRSMEVQPR